MNEQTGGLGSSTPSNVPMKRKQGRPHKVDSGVQGMNMPVMPSSSSKLNSNQTEAADTYLRGVVFLPERVVPVTAESDVAPQVRMTERTEIPIPVPVLNPETQIHSSVPSSGQSNKQPFEAELQVPVSVDLVLPTELYSGLSVSLGNQSAPVVTPMSDLSKIDSSISTGGIMPKGMSKPGPESQPASILSGFEGDKIIKQDGKLHEVDASRQAKESSADGGAIKDYQITSEPINSVPTVENTEKELPTGQQSMPSVYELNKLIADEPKHSVIEINQIPVSAERESMPPELKNNTVDNFMQKQGSPETGTQEDTKTKLAIETIPTVDTTNSNGRPSTDIANVPDVGSNHAPGLSHPSILNDRAHVPSESKL
ncbi:hypothetical protein GmHk_13G038202 [Glycine max]|nr:hypothetical protein GmHk_13G038202 [Glycine max]